MSDRIRCPVAGKPVEYLPLLKQIEACHPAFRPCPGCGRVLALDYHARTGRFMGFKRHNTVRRDAA